ncbi:MAG: DUF3526 domain-containing protein [Vicinamibacterales bacterium]
MPSRVEMIQAMREASDAANAEGASLLGRYYQDHPELAADAGSTTDFSVVRLAVDSRIAESVAPVAARFERQLDSQQRLADAVRFISPAILAQDALWDLAGTGAARHRSFVAQVEAFHRDWQRYFGARVARKEPLDDYHAVPRFSYVEEPGRAVALRVVGAIAGMVILTVLILVGARVEARRFTVAGR